MYRRFQELAEQGDQIDLNAYYVVDTQELVFMSLLEDDDLNYDRSDFGKSKAINYTAKRIVSDLRKANPRGNMAPMVEFILYREERSRETMTYYIMVDAMTENLVVTDDRGEVIDDEIKNVRALAWALEEFVVNETDYEEW